MTTRVALVPGCICMVQLALDRVRGLGHSVGLASQDRAAELVMMLLSPRPPSAASTVTVKHERSGGRVLVASSGGSQHFRLI